MKLTKQMLEALRLLAVAPRETAPAGGGYDTAGHRACISGMTGKALGARGFATSKGIMPTVWTITDAGREALAAIDGAGRQTTIEAEVSIDSVRLRVTGDTDV